MEIKPEEYGIIRLEAGREMFIPHDIRDEADIDKVSRYVNTLREHAERFKSIEKRVKEEAKKVSEEIERVSAHYGRQIAEIKPKLPMVKKSSYTTQSGNEIKFTHNKRVIRKVTPLVDAEILAGTEYGDCVIREIIPEHTEFKVDAKKLKERLEKEYAENGIPEDLFDWVEYQEVEVKL